MAKKVLAVFLAGFFLAASTLLPLSDFALMKELPCMYRSYCSVKAGGNPDVIDFAGDYLLGGKDLLGHNKHDAPVKTDGSLQFQHQANAMVIIFLQVKTVSVLLPETLPGLVATHPYLSTSDYQNRLFRPPVA